MTIIKFFMTLVLSVLISSAAVAQGKNKMAASLSMASVNLGVTFYEGMGEEAFERISAGGDRFNFPGDIYLVVVDISDGNKFVAHSANPDLIGMLASDPDSVKAAEIILPVVNEEGLWVSYMRAQPSTGKRGLKHAYVKLRDDYVFIGGYWK